MGDNTNLCDLCSSSAGGLYTILGDYTLYTVYCIQCSIVLGDYTVYTLYSIQCSIVLGDYTVWSVQPV